MKLTRNRGIAVYLLVLFLPGQAVLAGNRADINSDQRVDAVDLSVLTNILAGNLPVGNYDMQHVVVVAQQGGDFTDPADAADWVRTQSPTWQDPYVIFVASGLYFLDRPLVLPEFTALIGQCTSTCTIRRDATTGGAPDESAVLVVDGANSAEINSVTIENNGTVTPLVHVTGVFISDCNNVKIENTVINMSINGGFATGMYVERTPGADLVDVELNDCRMDVLADNGDNSFGIYNASAFVTIYHSHIRTSNMEADKDCFGIFSVENDYRPNTQVHYSKIRSSASASGTGTGYYVYEFGDGGTAIYFGVLNGMSKGSIVHGYCCDGSGFPVP